MPANYRFLSTIFTFSTTFSVYIIETCYYMWVVTALLHFTFQQFIMKGKEELSPIIIEKNGVVGLGWGFYTDYAKKQEITIDIR